MITRIFLLAALGLPFAFAQGQEDYHRIFSDDYDNAIRFLTEEEKWMDVRIQSHGLRPKEVKAIIFPELIRYSSIQDKMETFALESLYVQHGQAYANFSIGRFQIKPSFAENVEKDFLKMFGETELTGCQISASDTIQTVASRESRLKRMKNLEGQLMYVCLFFKIMDRRQSAWKTGEEKIKFLASAYNSEYRKPVKEINAFVAKKFFHAGFVATRKYSYADIAWYYFSN